MRSSSLCNRNASHSTGSIPQRPRFLTGNPDRAFRIFRSYFADANEKAKEFSHSVVSIVAFWTDIMEGFDSKAWGDFVFTVVARPMPDDAACLAHLNHLVERFERLEAAFRIMEDWALHLSLPGTGVCEAVKQLTKMASTAHVNTKDIYDVRLSGLNCLRTSRVFGRLAYLKGPFFHSSSSAFETS